MARYVQSIISTNAPTISPIVWRYIDMDSQLINNDSVFVDVSNGIVNLILPSTPTNASIIKISHVAGDIVQYNIIVKAIGKKINADNTLIIATKFRSIELIYSQVIGQWTILSDTAGSGGRTIIDTATNVFAKNNDFIYVDTSSNEVAVTLPSDPIIGNDITIIDKASTFDINNCIVIRNGEKILTKQDNLFLDVDKTITKFVYLNNNIGWRVFDVFANKWIGLSETTLFNDNGVQYDIVSILANMQSNSIYFTNTVNSECHLILPETALLGDSIMIIDYASSFNINNCIISGKLNGSIDTLTLDVQNSIVRLIYAGGDQGWMLFSATDNSLTFNPELLIATTNFSSMLVSGDMSVSSNSTIFVNSKIQPITIALPSFPAIGDIVRIVDIASTFNINNCTITAGSIDINSISENILLDESNKNSIFIYVNDQIGWLFYSSDLALCDLLPNMTSSNLAVDQFRIVTTNVTLANFEMVFIDTRTGPVSLTLPLNSVIGNQIIIFDLYLNFSANHCTLINNGNNIEGLMESLIINESGQCLTLIYSGVEFGWIIW